MPAADLDALIREWGAEGRTIERIAGALWPDRDISAAVANSRAARKTVELVARALGDGEPPVVADFAERSAAVHDAWDRAQEDRPDPDPTLDHVAATRGTFVARAQFLDFEYRLDGSHVVFLGDHDLTSVAVAALDREARLSVVDVDQRVLEHISRVAPTVECHHADLRDGLPAALSGSADLVFTDPPYSPMGVALFVALGLQSLRDHDHGRVVLSYGYGEQHPALGYKVQDELNRLRLVIESLRPDFNQYRGAEAIGGWSDLYVLRPTRRSRAAAERVARSAGRQIYSKGPEAQERR